MAEKYVDEADKVWIYRADSPNEPKWAPRADLADAVASGWFPLTKQADEPTKTDAFVRGGAQGATLNTADEVAGVGAGYGAFAQTLADNPKGRSGLRGLYQRIRDADEAAGDARVEGRDEHRAEDERVKGAEPGAFMGGEIAGAIGSSIAIPGAYVKTLGRSLLTGGAQGGAAAAGRSKEIGDIPGDALVGVGAGMLGGAAGHGAGKLVQAGGAALSRKAAEKVPEAIVKADTARVLTSMGATGGTIGKPAVLEQLKRVPGADLNAKMAKAAGMMRETPGLAPKLGTVEGIKKAARATEAEAGDVIGSIIKGTDAAGTKVSTSQFSTALRMEALDLATTRPLMKDAATRMFQLADEMDELYPDGMTMAQAQVIKKDFGDAVNWVAAGSGQKLPGAQEAAATAAHETSAAMDAAADLAFAGKPLPVEVNAAMKLWRGNGIPTEALDAYRRARSSWQISRIVGDAAEENLQRAGKNRSWTMAVGDAAKLGNERYGVAGAVAGAVGAKSAQVLGGTGRATLAEASAAMLKRLADPAFAARAGAWGSKLSQAAARGGPQAAGAVYWEAKMTDPAFAAVAAEVEQEPTPPKRRGLRDLQ